MTRRLLSRFAIAMALMFALLRADKCAAGLINGRYEFQVQYSPVCLNGVYPMTLGDMKTGCSLAAKIDGSGNITGATDLRTLIVPVAGTVVSANGKVTLQLRTSDQNPAPLRGHFNGELQGKHFVGTATRQDGTVAFDVDVTSTALLQVTFDLHITVNAGQVTGTGTASSCGVQVPVNVTGSNTPDKCTLSVTGVDLPHFVWNGSGKPSYAGFTATYSATGFGISTSGSGVIVAPKPTAPALLANISTRLAAQTGENVLIAGFIVTGSKPKKVMVRAIGPSLPVAGKLIDPQLELHNAAGAIIAKNDNWSEAANKQAIIDSTIPPTAEKEAAILTTLNPGAYTAIVSGVNGTTGVALAEVYDLDVKGSSRLANISTRGYVQTADNVMIGGLIILGNAPQRVMVRAIGPSLPVSNKLADPILELHDPNGGLLASNNDWGTDYPNDIRATTIAPESPKESAIVAALLPGAYTAIVRGVNGATGVALVEAYGLNP